MATYFADVTLFDGRTARPRTGVLVSDGRIRWVGAHRRAPGEARAATSVDGGGRTLTPGLIDCHVHLCFDGSPDFLAEAAVTEPYAAVKCVANAARMAGVSLAEGIEMASARPRQLLGLPVTTIEVGQPADLMLFEWEEGGELKVREVV